MTKPFSPENLTDYLLAFDAGVNSGISPLILPRNAMADSTNITFRGTFAQPRPPYRKLALTYPSLPVQTLAERGFFQGAAYYVPDTGPASLMAAINGQLYRFTPDQFGAGVVDAIPMGVDLNPASQPQAWLWQAEKWLIWQDGLSLPYFFDGNTLRRSAGGSVRVGVIAAPGFVPPLVNTPVDITLSLPYTGPINVPILIGNAIYLVTTIGGAIPQTGYALVLQNVNDIPGNTVPVGATVQYDPGFVGLSANMFTLLGNGSPPTNFNTFATQFSWVPAGSFGDIRINGHLCSLSGAAAPTTLSVFSHSSTNFAISVGAVIKKSVSGAVISLGTVAQDVTLFPPPLVGGFYVPPVGGSVTIYVTQQYAGAVGKYITINGAYYLITALGSNVPPIPGTVIRAINLIDTPDTVNRHYYPLAVNPYGDDVRTMPEMLAGRMGAYGMGRNWYSLIDGISFRATDLVGESSGTAAENFRDAVLKEAQNLYLNTSGNFRIPGQTGSIRAMRFIAIMNRALGQGPLQVATPRCIFSCNAPVDRASWQTLANPILTETLKPKGALGQNSTINSNSDLIYRAPDGIRSEVLGVRDFVTWGNVPISREVATTLDLDDASLLNFGSAIEFDNRMIMTAAPHTTALGCQHSKLVVINYDLVSSLRGKKEPVWDGLWDGLEVLQLLVGEFFGVDRAFAFCAVNGKIELHELLPTQTPIIADNGVDPIVWTGVSSGLDFGETDPRTRNLKRLLDGEIYVDQLLGPVQFEVYYKPDEYQPWQLWHSWIETGGTPGNPKYRPRMGLGEPSPDPFDPDTQRPLREGYVFQVKFIITGHCRFLGARFKSVTMPEPQFALPADLVSPTIPRITDPGAFAPLPVGVPFVFVFTVVGDGPFIFAITGGELPPGLVLDPTTGTISGTPTTPGTSTFTVSVTGSSFPHPTTGTKTFTVTVDAAVLTPLAWFPMGEVGNVDHFDVVNAIPIPINPTVPVGVLNAAGKIQPQGVEFSVVGAGQSGLLGDGVSFGFPQSLISGLSIVTWVKWRSAWNPNVQVRLADFQIYGPGPGFNLNFDLKLLWDPTFYLGFGVFLDQFSLPTNSFTHAFVPVVGQWYFVHVYYDGASGKIGLSLDNAAATESIGFGGLLGGFDSSINDIYLENDTGQVVLSEYGIFPFKLSPAQLTYIYNAGVGKSWPFVLPP